MFTELKETYDPVTSASDCTTTYGWFDVAFGVFLIVGIYISWLPQVHFILFLLEMHWNYELIMF